MKEYIRPLTRTMLSSLVQCRKIELEGKVCMPDEIKYALAPLYKRGYISLRKTTINGKEIMAVFTTPSGLNCLQQLNEKVNNQLEVNPRF
jgi:hypothetical protein